MAKTQLRSQRLGTKTKSPKAQDIFSNPKTSVARDGFQNVFMKIGVATPRGEGSNNNLISQGRYYFNLITRNRILLEEMYRGSWLIGRGIDCFAEDMTRKGITITTNEGADKLQKFRVQLSRLQIWNAVRRTTAWGRLYGGCIGVMQIKGQKTDTPLDPDTVGKGQFLGIVAYDRWQLNPILTELIKEGPDLGLPAMYEIVLGGNIGGTGATPGVSPTPGNTQRIHYSRCFRMGGHELPFFQAITEMMWEESIVERVYDRVIAYDTASASTAGLIDKALLRTVSVDKLREVLGTGGVAEENLIKFFQYMQLFQTSQGITLLDKEDDFKTAAYSFAGLSDVNNNFAQEVSGAFEVPLTRLFGQSPQGLNASGEGDMKIYHETINAKQEANLRNPMELICQIAWQSKFDEPLPSDFEFEFTPLEEIPALEKSQITTANTASIVSAHDSGLMDTSTAMKELKQQSASSGVFTHIKDEDIEEAENEEPPEPELDNPDLDVDPNIETEKEPGEETGTQVGKVTNPKKKSGDSSWFRRAWKAMSRAGDKGVKATIKEFEAGTLKSGSGKKVTSKKQALAIGYSEEGKDEKVSDDRKAIRDWLKK